MAEVEVTTTATGTTKFGLGQLDNPTPKWATWVFRIALYLFTFASIAVAMIPAKRLNPENALEIILYLNIALLAVHMGSKMVGVDISRDADDANSFRKTLNK